MELEKKEKKRREEKQTCRCFFGTLLIRDYKRDKSSVTRLVQKKQKEKLKNNSSFISFFGATLKDKNKMVAQVTHPLYQLIPFPHFLPGFKPTDEM
jgi:hypothetical protein